MHIENLTRIGRPIRGFGYNPIIRNGRPMPHTWSILQAGNLFVFAINNPVMFIDPTGLIIEIAGTAAQRDVIMRDLRQLTHDTLSWTACTVRSDIWIVGHTPSDNWAVGTSYLSSGTELVRRLIDSEHTTTIITVGSYDNRANTITGMLNGNNTIYFAPSQTVEVLVLRDGGRHREVMPSFLILGHELIHSLRWKGGNHGGDATGITLANPVPRVFAARNDGEEWKTIGVDFYRNGVRVNASQWRITENALRREQNQQFGTNFGKRLNWWGHVL